MMKKTYFQFAVGMMLMVLLLSPPASSQTGDDWKNLRKELEALKEGQKAIQKDIQQIKNILRARGLLDEVPPNLFMDISGRPFQGDIHAKVILMEFSEYA